MFFVIEGFLDVSLPTEDDKFSSSAAAMKAKEGEQSTKTQTPFPSSIPSTKKKPTKDDSRPPVPKHAKTSKHLFTVKAGGIAGYFCTSFHNIFWGYLLI